MTDQIEQFSVLITNLTQKKVQEFDAAIEQRQNAMNAQKTQFDEFITATKNKVAASTVQMENMIEEKIDAAKDRLDKTLTKTVYIIVGVISLGIAIGILLPAVTARNELDKSRIDLATAIQSGQEAVRNSEKDLLAAKRELVMTTHELEAKSKKADDLYGQLMELQKQLTAAVRDAQDARAKIDSTFEKVNDSLRRQLGGTTTNPAATTNGPQR